METINKLFLELSQVSTARTSREIKLQSDVDELLKDKQKVINEEFNAWMKLAVAKQTCEKVMAAIRESSDLWTPEQDDETWSEDAHVTITLTVAECRRVQTVIKQSIKA
jgi:hypothetical protein